MEEYEFCVREGDDLGWVGYFIGKSDVLKELVIQYIPAETTQLDEFIEGLNRNQSIEKLIIINDSILEKIGPLFRINKNITDLCLQEFSIGQDSARNTASMLDDATLENISFCHNNLGEEEFEVIARASGRQTQLKKPNAIDDEGLQALIAGIANCINLEELCLSESQLITVTGFMALSALFQSRNFPLRELTLSGMNIGDDGMNCLPGWASLHSLKELNLGFSSIGHEGLQSLIAGITNISNLEKLHLSGNPLMAVGLGSLSTLFQSESCRLKELYLCCMNFGDEGVEALAGALAGNKSLIHLYIFAAREAVLTDSYGFAESEWKILKKLKCDTSSIDSTYLSNHYLMKIVGSGVGAGGKEPPPDVQKYLQLNALHEKAVAYCKILVHHPDLDIKPFFQWKMKFLPLVIDWFERALYWDIFYDNWISREEIQSRKLSALYNYVRGIPLLAVDAHYSHKKTHSRKRKIDLCEV
jgi:hypothetical protein